MVFAPLNFLASSYSWNPLTESHYVPVRAITCQSSRKSWESVKTDSTKDTDSTELSLESLRDLPGEYQVCGYISLLRKKKAPKLPLRIHLGDTTIVTHFTLVSKFISFCLLIKLTYAKMGTRQSTYQVYPASQKR